MNFKNQQKENRQQGDCRSLLEDEKRYVGRHDWAGIK